MQNCSLEFSLFSKASKLSSSSLNPLNTLPERYISRVRKDVEDFIGVADRCKLIWQTIMKSPLIKFPLGNIILQRVFRTHEDDIYKYIKLSSMQQFMNMFDADKDNYLNEDQIVSVFVFIKNKAQGIANDSIQIQEYNAFKQLMKQVRTLQSYITQWQDNLRTRIYDGQLNEYQEIGNAKIDQFCQKYQLLFERLEATKQDRRWELQKKLNWQSQELEIKLSDPLTLVKIKPNNKLKQLQLKQKLVCLQERVDQALNYRTQLNRLETIQENRVTSLIQSTTNQQRKVLRIKHEKLKKELEGKLDQLSAKLTIQMNKQYNVLIKRNKLHQNQIKKIQAIARRLGKEKGIKQPELHRTKIAQDEKNSLLTQFKRNNRIGLSTKLVTEVELPSLKSMQSLDTNTSFNLNEKQVLGRRERRVKTVQKYLQASEKQKAYPLCGMYNKSLMQINNPEIRLTTKMSKLEESRKKTILSKIKSEA